MNLRNSAVPCLFSIRCFSCLFIHTMSRKPMQFESPIDMFHGESWIPVYFGVKGTVKVMRHKKQSVSVFGWDAMLPVAEYISCVGFSPMQCPTIQAMLVTLGFPCITSSWLVLLPTVGFHAESASGKNIAGVGHATLVSAAFF